MEVRLLIFGFELESPNPWNPNMVVFVTMQDPGWAGWKERK
jgi:hypothetical protein